MTTDLMTDSHPAESVEQTSSSRKKMRKNLEPTVQDILARAKTNRPSARGTWICAGLSTLLLWASFTPLDWGALGWVALVPLLMLVRLEMRTEGFYRVIWATSFLGWLGMLQWMRLGDAAMYPAWFALAFYVSLYVPVFVFCCRTALHRWSVPLTLAAPLVWIGLEYFRAHLLTGFSWYYLGHTQYRWLEIIQISDLVGVYGVSALLVLSSAVIASLIPVSVFDKCSLLMDTRLERGTVTETRRPLLHVAGFLVIFAAVLGYGYQRRSAAEFKPGPRVALIQGNFTSSLKHDPNEKPNIFRTHDALTHMSIEHHPDLIVWPETMFPEPLADKEPGMTDEQLLEVAPTEARMHEADWLKFWNDNWAQDILTTRSQMANAGMMIGVQTRYATPEGVKTYNSAAFLHPQLGYSGRYDKVHRVIFGEYIPLKETLPGLHSLTPFSGDFGIDKGDSFRSFKYQDLATGREWTFAPVICFEDTVPRVVRAAAQSGPDGETVDCLVNLTNDGWFHGSSELDQHLITATFRAVECRTPIARAVNTGISAFIDGDGAILEPEVFEGVDDDQTEYDTFRDESGHLRKGLNAMLVHEVPLDPRESFYLKHGDWFGQSCGFGTMLLFLTGIFLRKRPARVTPEQKAA
ncbi:MAG: apolipoprotein N-acyltransferase [Planctomycetaceae bacterium]|nr:apolipoprotein N-acyltransferase [Planctomycetaceae bacterium]